MPGPIHRRLLKPVLGLSTSLVLLGVVEGALWAADVPDPGLYDGDLSTVWWLRPDLQTTQRLVEEDLTFSITTNALGLRGAMPPQDEPWTLALGCSTTFGWGVSAEQAWPEQLAQLTGQTIINGGTPGWSTHQARLGAQRWLALEPDRVILSYIVRDAQPSSRQDAASQPTPWILRTHIARLLQSRLSPSTGPTTGLGTLPEVRVPPEAYRDNLAALVEQAGSAEVVLLAFPQQEPAAAWRSVLASMPQTVLTPELEPASFFAHDPIHLNAAGHQALARLLAADPAVQSTPPPRR